MKIKNIYAALGVILTSGSLVSAQTKESLSNNISQAHKKTFGVENVFDQTLSFLPWEQVFNEIANFVDKNAGGNEKLWQAFNECGRVKNVILFSIKGFYKPRQMKMLLDQSKENLKKEAAILENTRYYIDAEKKNSVKELLLKLILKLESTIDTVLRDYSMKKRP